MSTYQHAITRKPPQSMANGITTQSEVVDIKKAQEQHHNYVSQLQTLGINVTVLDPEEAFPDSHFVEDTAIIHKKTAFLTRPGAKARRGEVRYIKPVLEKVMDVCDLGGDDDTLVDGGDIIMTQNRVLIGIYERTNLKGAQRLKALLLDVNPTLEIHFVPFSGVLHLKTGLTALNDNVFIGNPRIKIEKPLDFAEIKWLPENEAYAANTLTVNGATFHFHESQSANSIIKDTGLNPVPFQLSEFRKMDGSFTCLSLLY